MIITNKKHGKIALVGLPNTGKSTITNSLVGQKISIVSPKVQTTRNSIKAIVTENNKQLIVIDTPGIFIPRQDKPLERSIVRSAWQGLRESNHIFFIIDAKTGLSSKNIQVIKNLKQENLPMSIVVNKIDLVEKSTLLEMFSKIAEFGFEEIIPVSATSGDGMGTLRKVLFEKCLEDSWLYEEDQISEAPMSSIACEITREKLFLYLEQEIPYSATVKNDSYKILNNGDVKIYQTIYVLKESQKKIILGKGGTMIKKIGLASRLDFSKICGSKVHLFLLVKTKENWLNEKEEK